MHLRTLYEEGLEIIQRIRLISNISYFEIQHVYREFNANADSTANESIDNFHGAPVVVNGSWRPCVLSARVLEALRDANHGERDENGDVAVDPDVR